MKKVDMPRMLRWFIHDFIWALLILGFVLTEIIIVKQMDEKAKEEKQIVVTFEKAPEPIHYLTDQELSRLFSCKDDANNDTCPNITVEDAEMLMKIGYAEDRESAESQAGIQRVILNRLDSPLFPNSIKEIIYQKNSNGKYQFSTVANGSFQSATPDLNSHLALAMIEKGEVDLESLFFEAEWAKDTWQSNNLEYETTIGGTRYYKLP